MDSPNDTKTAESSQSYATAVTSGTSATPNQSGVVTRDQQRRINASNDAIEDADNKVLDPKKRDKDAFKGTVTEIDGHVFQLAEEGRKNNQSEVPHLPLQGCGESISRLAGLSLLDG
jgi:hypothetical protein